jgi:hypothetical protein
MSLTPIPEYPLSSQSPNGTPRRRPLFPLLSLSFTPSFLSQKLPPVYGDSSLETLSLGRIWGRTPHNQGKLASLYGTPPLHLLTRTALTPCPSLWQSRSPRRTSSESHWRAEDLQPHHIAVPGRDRGTTPAGCKTNRLAMSPVMDNLSSLTWMYRRISSPFLNKIKLFRNTQDRDYSGLHTWLST